MKLYQHIAQIVEAYQSCKGKDTHQDWAEKHAERLQTIVRNFLPSGSGFDCGTGIDLDESAGQRLVFSTEFHHMDESGGYDGWTAHRVVVIPDLVRGFDMRVTGRNINDIKNYVGDVFHDALDADVDPKHIDALMDASRGV